MTYATPPHPFHRYFPPGQGEPRPLPADLGPYYPDKDLALAVNTALSVGQPLLVTGEPGCGKTTLAWSVAAELGLPPVLRFHTRSDHGARDLLYSFDHLHRLHDAQVHDPRAREPQNYVRLRALGRAIYLAQRRGQQRVVLIDEIDKAPPDFPNDLLDEIDRMRFTIAETGQRFRAPAGRRPIVIITSNSERQLPRPFLRRCVYHHIRFPEPAVLVRILKSRFDAAAHALCERAVARFMDLRAHRDRGLQRPPATGELITWVRVLVHAQVPLGRLRDEIRLWELDGLGALVKSEDDLRLLQDMGR